MTAFEKVNKARAKGRPTSQDFIRELFTGWLEMHGDRRFADDQAIICGLAWLNQQPLTVIATEKGHDVKARTAHNFGSANPEGYRKALRQMRLAEKFHRPIVCLVDTSGAYCGIGAEERGQGQAIAENIMEMMTLRTPIIAIIIGEGGSGGALALAVADEVWMLENAIYSVISPEGCASILWKDTARTKEAAECLQLTAPDLLRLGVVDRIFSETSEQYATLQTALSQTIAKYQALTDDELCVRRYHKFRVVGGSAE